MSHVFILQGVFLLIVGIIPVIRSRDGCEITLRFPSIESPLFPSSLPKSRSGRNLETPLEPLFHYPEIVDRESQVLKMNSKGPIPLTCPGKRNNILNKAQTVASLSCSRSGRVLYVDKERTRYPEIACDRRPRGCLMHTNASCHGDQQGIVHVIGWKIQERWYLPQITVCWDPIKETTIYTRHVLYGSSLSQRVASPGRPTFKPGKHYTGNIRSVFTRKSQVATLGPILGEGIRVPGEENNYYFARGHLVPDADFVLPAEQDNTYYYYNAIPQFQKFNNGNWKRMENSVRNLAESRSHSFIIYTGTMDILTLRDVNNNLVPIYLDPEAHLYPVPLILWKVVYDPMQEEAIALLGLNYIEDDAEILERLFSLCDDICNTLSWPSWKSKDWKRGALSCCSWNQFQKYVPKLAAFGQVRLLND